MKKTILICAAMAALCFNACKKNTDNNPTAPVYGTYSSLDTIFTMLQAPSKFVNVDASIGGSFYGLSGTRYEFPAGVFQDGYGNIITGIVQVEVKEILTKGDMIFTKALTVSGTDPILSAGEIYTNATQTGAQVYLRPGYAFTANIPQGKTPQKGMSLFNGNVITGAVNNVNWNSADSIGSGAIVYNGDTVSIISDSLQWCNADAFMTSPNFQTFKVTISLVGTTASLPAQVNTYALYDTYKGVWPMGIYGSMSSTSNGVYSETHVPNIPVHFASFCIVNGKFYGGVTAATPVNGGTYNILLTEVDPTAFKGQLSNLTN